MLLLENVGPEVLVGGGGYAGREATLGACVAPVLLFLGRMVSVAVRWRPSRDALRWLLSWVSAVRTVAALSAYHSFPYLKHGAVRVMSCEL